jgi:SAM-dependent methyltransferase
MPANTPDSSDATQFGDRLAEREALISRYNTYQAKYVENIRESDRAIIEHILQAIDRSGKKPADCRLLDIACSTGSLLIHLRKAFPDMKLAGVDLETSSINTARANELLKGVELFVEDATKLDFSSEFDFIITNAFTWMLDHDAFRLVSERILSALKPGGSWVAFEWTHEFNHDICIHERSNSHPNGIRIYSRPMNWVQKSLQDAGFDKVAFHPFQIPIDLKRGAVYTNNDDGFEDLNSYTIKTEEGGRLLFRGSVCQPWCHMVASKPV